MDVHSTMARRRKTKTTSSRPKLGSRFKLGLSWFKSLDKHTWQRSSVGLLWLFTVTIVILAWILGVPRLEAFASNRELVSPHEVTIRFVNPPQWIKGPLGDSLLRTATMQIGGDPLRRDDLVAVRQALIDTGWFYSVDQVRRVQSDLVEITAAFVHPYTLIRDGSGYHLIDVEGKLLPKSYGPGDDLPMVYDSQRDATVSMIAISGAHFKRPPVGKSWDGADVSAGLKLLQLIDRQPWRHQIIEVDVSQFLKDGPIKLRTDRGSVILWGGPPGEEAALELLAAGKIQRLNLLYANHGRIDGNRVGELDITGEKVAVAR